MTCLMDRSLSGALIKLHTSMLGTFFVYTLGQSMPIFKKKSSQRFLGKSSELCVLHKNDFLYNTQSLELFPRNLCEDFFLKIGIQKTSPTQKYVTSSLPRSELFLSSKSLQCFTNRVCKLLLPSVSVFQNKQFKIINSF